MVYGDIPEELRVLIEPVVEDHGCELVDVEVKPGSGGGLIRITLDRAAGDGRVSIDCCEKVSREIEVQLEAASAIAGTYRLEVSSPGLDRVLAREKDFEAACGREVKVHTRRPLEGRRRFKGRLLCFENGVVRLRVDGEDVDVPFKEVEKANALYEFSREDFAGAGSGCASK